MIVQSKKLAAGVHVWRRRRAAGTLICTDRSAHLGTGRAGNVTLIPAIALTGRQVPSRPRAMPSP
jgi:hypothetical protein